MSEINILQFQLDTSNIILEPTNFNTEEVEWIADQGRYGIQLKVDGNVDFDNVNFILTNSQGTIKELFGATYSSQEEGYKIYEAFSNVAMSIKGGSSIRIGVQYTVEGVPFRTEGIPVKVKNSIANNDLLLDPEDDSLPSSIKQWIQLASRFDDAKAISKIQTVKCKELVGYSNEGNITVSYPEKDDGSYLQPDEDGADNEKYCLLIHYKGEDYPTYGGLISIDAVEMGLIAPYDGEYNDITVDEGNGGGGKVGAGADLFDTDTLGAGTQRGFAGGRAAYSNDGAAVGYGAQSNEGFAGGSQAKASKRNIAIGKDANVLSDKDDGIAIGTNAIVYNSAQAVAIGKRSQIYNSARAIIIGGESSNSNTDGENIINKSYKAIEVGTKLNCDKSDYSILIGSNINVTRPEYETVSKEDEKMWSNISIGASALAAERGCVAIGPGAISGCFENPDPDKREGIQSSYKTYMHSSEAHSEPAAIALGRHACAYGHASVSIGKHSVASRLNSIAIGTMAQAGPDFDNYDRDNMEKANSGNNGVHAIAIGYGAKAKANGAVQLSYGTNTTANSLQFQAVPIVKNGYVQVNLNEGKGTTGILSVKNGGTGATEPLSARRNIGLVTGIVHREPTLDWGFKGAAITGRDFTFNFAKELKYKFTTAPRIFLSLRFKKEEQLSPLSINYYVKEITKEHFVVRVDYKPTDWDTTKKNATKLGIWFEVLAVGGSPKYVGGT